jgi:RHS repeat-associated protein
MDIYTYDNLNRLTGVTGPSSLAMTYAANGNILSKSQIGNYTYGGPRPHAVTSVTNPNGLISTTTQRVTYTSFNKVDSIIQANLVYTVTYGKDDQRTISKLFDNGTLQKTVYYVGDYEKEVKPGNHIRQIHYIAGGDGMAAIFVKNDGMDTLYYVHTDHLGSVNVISAQNGSVIRNYSFDAWGRRRNPTDWTYNNVPANYLFSRGYTGHEMLDQFILINMNGRIYDPLLARFLNPDNFVQLPEFTQNFNKYSYCFNNPLSYTDPSGEWFIPLLFFIGQYVIDWLNNTVNEGMSPKEAFLQTPISIGIQGNIYKDIIRPTNNYTGNSGPGISLDDLDNLGNYGIEGFGNYDITSDKFQQADGGLPVFGPGGNSLGDQVNDFLKIRGLTCTAYYWYDKNSSYYFGETGVYLTLFYTSNDAKDKYVWIQRYSYNHGPWIVDNKGSESIGYYSKKELKEQIIGNTISFHDAPRTPMNNISNYRLILSLWKGNDRVFSLFYGYKSTYKIITPFYPRVIIYP